MQIIPVLHGVKLQYMCVCVCVSVCVHLIDYHPITSIILFGFIIQSFPLKIIVKMTHST